jgi:hypothetical protein
MPSKRPHSSAAPSNGSVSSDQGPPKRAHADSASPGPTVDTWENSVGQCPLKVYIISAKLLPDVLGDLVCLVEKNAAPQGNKAGAKNLELTTSVEHADVVVTAVHTRPRLERHVCWEVAVRGPSHLLHILR